MVISVIGLGKLGLCTAACFASAGYRVYGFDINKVLIKTLKKGEVPFFEPGLKDLLNRVKNNLLKSKLVILEPEWTKYKVFYKVMVTICIVIAFYFY